MAKPLVILDLDGTLVANGPWSPELEDACIKAIGFFPPAYFECHAFEGVPIKYTELAIAVFRPYVSFLLQALDSKFRLGISSRGGAVRVAAVRAFLESSVGVKFEFHDAGPSCRKRKRRMAVAGAGGGKDEEEENEKEEEEYEKVYKPSHPDAMWIIDDDPSVWEESERHKIVQVSKYKFATIDNELLGFVYPILADHTVLAPLLAPLGLQLPDDIVQTIVQFSGEIALLPPPIPQLFAEWQLNTNLTPFLCNTCQWVRLHAEPTDPCFECQTTNKPRPSDKEKFLEFM